MIFPYRRKDEGMYTYRLTLCYDGTRYRGWQRQGNTDNTIQARVESALSHIVGEEIELAASGRTDAGVHAAGQVCSFHTSRELDCDEVLCALRRVLCEDIGALSLAAASPRFHARLNCREKTYVYRVWNSAEPNVFERRYMCRYEAPLDLSAMRRAADALIGRHDFTSFCANKHMKKSAVRELRSVEIERLGGEVRFTLTGDGFLYNMVRIIVGTLLEVGTHARPANEMPQLLAARDRERAGFTAAAQGLTLESVRY